MPRRRSAGVSRLLSTAGIRRKSPTGYSGGYGGGPIYQDSFRSRRAPTLPELVEAFKSICYACAGLNAGGVVRTPLRLYAATKSGQARPKCVTRDLRRTYVGRERIRWLTKAADYSQYLHTADDVDEVMEHPILEVLKRPNPDFDHHGLIRHTVLSLDMVGAFYWEPERDERTADGVVPDQFWPLLAQYVYPYRWPGQSQIKQYNYFADVYDPATLIRGRFVGLRDPYGYGYGPAQAASEYTGLRDQFVSVQDNMLSQGFRPSAVISLKDGTMPMGRDELRRLENDANSKWRGEASGRLFFINGGLDVNTLNFPPSDLAALQISDNALQQVANCFGVPLSLLKTEDVNLANAEAGHRQHAELAVQPRCVLIASAITRWIHAHGEGLRKAFSRDPGWERLFVAFDNPVAEDKERGAKIWDMRLKNGSAVVNEYRNAEGEDNVDWGDEPILPQNMVTFTGEPPAPKALPAPAVAGPQVHPDKEETPDEETEAGAEDEDEKEKPEKPSPSPAAASRNGKEKSAAGRNGFHSKMSPPLIDPDEDEPEEESGEKNTYGLPTGDEIRRELIRWFEQQRAEVLGTTHVIGVPVPHAFPPLTDYSDRMASAMTPMIGAYWDRAGKRTMERLGLDPDEWKVTNPHLRDLIHEAAFAFCDSTNATTSLHLDTALAKLREELTEGLVSEGETLDQLTKRVNSIFNTATKSRASRIAATEASRAVHAAQERAAVESGVVVGFEWLVSGDACSRCLQIAAEVRSVRLGQEFAVIGDNPNYMNVRHPPAHPACQCSLIEILSPEYGGPEDPEFGTTLDQPNPSDDYTPPAGVAIPEPEPERAPVLV